MMEYEVMFIHANHGWPYAIGGLLALLALLILASLPAYSRRAQRDTSGPVPGREMERKS